MNTLQPTMKAIVYTEFGPPDVLRLEEVTRPEPKRGEILVRVRASSVNFGDIMARSFRSVTPQHPASPDSLIPNGY